MSEKRIFKYTLDIVDWQLIRIHKDAELLHVDMQLDSLCLWARLTPGLIIDRAIIILGTGNQIPTKYESLPYIGSALDLRLDLVWHVFDGG